MSSRDIPSMYMSDHSVMDESYNVVGDFWEDSKYGDKRSLALEHRDGSLVYVYIPNSLASNNSSLFGSVMTKRVTTEFFLNRDEFDITLDADIDERPSHTCKPVTLQTPLMKKIVSDNENKNNVRKIERKLYDCKDCSKRFTREVNLTRHVKTLHNFVKYTCFKCNRKYTRQDVLAKHMKKTH
jgi:uncharacterized Zn-finger protein